ncbi:MAG TPA: DinB family protein [Gemmatimonadaceae bacterium]|nr:DinB family protein [Gemmatimonadaceae bacterium]
MNRLEQFTDVWTRENATTRRVLHALPADQAEFRPSPNTKTAREVAYIFSLGQGGIAAALTNQWQWPPPQPRTAPATLDEVRAAFDTSTAAVRDALAKASESQFDETVTFFTAPKQLGPVKIADLVWFMLLDSVHHRGQLSIYLRGMQAKVPSIYGPTADEPWM